MTATRPIPRNGPVTHCGQIDSRVVAMIVVFACAGCTSNKSSGAVDSVPSSWPSGNPATGSGTTGPTPGTLTPTGRPSTTTGVPGEWIDVSAGNVVTCGLRSTGEAECWGFQLFSLQSEPPTPFLRVATEYDRACGLDAGGGVECWSCVGVSECGPPPGTYTTLRAGSAGLCALRGDGTAACWDNEDELEQLVQGLPPGVMVENEDTTVCVLPAIPSEPVCVSDPPEMSLREPPAGGDGDDAVVGGSGTDQLWGDDYLGGGSGDDTLCDKSFDNAACQGAQLFYGDAGDDTLWLTYDAGCDPGSDFDAASDAGAAGSDVCGHTSWSTLASCESWSLTTEPAGCVDPN